VADRNPRRLCVSHSPFNGADFVGRGQVISCHPVNRFGGEFGTNTKLMHGVIDPISTPTDYPNAVFDDVVSLRGSLRKNALSWSPQENLQLVANNNYSLPVCKKFFPYKKGICYL